MANKTAKNPQGLRGWVRNRETHRNGRPTEHELHEARRKINHYALTIDQAIVNISGLTFELSRTPRRTEPDNPQSTQVIDDLDYLHSGMDYLELGLNQLLLWYQLTNPARAAARDRGR